MDVPWSDEPEEELSERLRAFDKAAANPEVKKGLSELRELVDRGFITPADLGGITQKELDGAYASAARVLHVGKPAKALKILGTLIYVDPRQARFFTLAGVALQRLSEFSLAERYYSMALDIDDHDATAWLYCGEVQLHLGNRDRGRETLARGLQLASQQPALQQVALRARAVALSHGFRDEDVTALPEQTSTQS